MKKQSYLHYRKVFQSIDDEKLMALSLRKGIGLEAEAALEAEMGSRGLQHAIEMSGPIHSGARASMFEARIATIGPAFFRLFLTSFIFLLIVFALQNQPLRVTDLDWREAITKATEVVFLAPGILFFCFAPIAGVWASIAIWATLMTTALGSSSQSTRRWFHVFLTIHAVLTLLGLTVIFEADLITMVQALK